MNNAKQIIDNHNKQILKSYTQANDTATANPNTIQNKKTCNCRQKNTCPLEGNCLQSSVIYQATVTRNDNNTTETYIGLTENDFKTRYRNHTASFRHSKHRNSTEYMRGSNFTHVSSAVHIYDFHIFILTYFTIVGYITNSQLAIYPWGLVTQWIEHCTGIARSWVRIPFKPEFFSGCFFNCLS